MKILVTGATGQLGSAIYKRFQTENQVCGVARSGTDVCLDITHDEDLYECIAEFSPEVIINCAGYVTIEGCEESPGRAYMMNARLPAVLGDICEKRGIYFVHISTDHFYYGDMDKKHSEEERVQLVNEYSRTKYFGETALIRANAHLILRTNFVGFSMNNQRDHHGHKRSYLDWVLSNLQANREIELYNDYYTSGIYVEDFCDVLEELLQIRPSGLYNLASSDTYSKETFVVTLSEKLFGRQPRYISTSVRKMRGAKRADSLGLDTSKIAALLGHGMPTLDDLINKIADDYRKGLYEEAD